MFTKANLAISDNSYSYYSCNILGYDLGLTIDDMGYFECYKDYYTARSGLDNFLLILTLDGSGQILYNDKTEKLNKGSLMLINCNNFHEYKTVGNSWNFYYFHMSGHNANYLVSKTVNSSSCVFDVTSMPLKALFEEALTLSNINTTFKQVKSNKILLQIFEQLLSSRKENVATNNTKNEGIEKALRYIEDNYCSQITLDDLSSIASLSKFHFIRTFKEYYSLSPHDYILSLRLAKAKNMLSTTSSSIEEITLALGYENTSSFIRTFNKYVGTTPLKFRNS